MSIHMWYYMFSTILPIFVCVLFMPMLKVIKQYRLLESISLLYVAIEYDDIIFECFFIFLIPVYAFCIMATFVTRTTITRDRERGSIITPHICYRTGCVAQLVG